MNLRAKIEKLVSQWNMLKPREKKAMYNNNVDKLIKLRDRFYKQGKIKEGKEIVTLMNKQGGLKGDTLREANKTQHNILVESLTKAKDKRWIEKIKKQKEEKDIDRKLKNIYKKAGIVANYHQLTMYDIPNPLVLKAGFKKFLDIQQRHAKKMTPKEVEEQAKLKWALAQQEARQIKYDHLKDNAVKYVGDFLDIYFKNLFDKDLVHEMKAYLEHLPLQKIYQIQNMLLSQKFMRIWDSEQESDTYNPDWNMNRARDVIKVLQNETGVTLTWNDETRSYDKSKSKMKGTYYTIMNLI